MIVLPVDAFTLDDAPTMIEATVAVEGILSSIANTLLISVAGNARAKRVPMLVVDKIVHLLTGR